jgi:hypothetical protein
MDHAPSLAKIHIAFAPIHMSAFGGAASHARLVSVGVCGSATPACLYFTKFNPLCALGVAAGLGLVGRIG